MRLISAVEEFGYDASVLSEVSPDDILMFSLGSREESGHIEITNLIAGIHFEEAYKHTVIKTIEDIPVEIIHFNDLIKNKSASTRHKDLDDVENLINISRKKPGTP